MDSVGGPRIGHDVLVNDNAISGIKAKLARAVKHLEDVDRLAYEFMGSDPIDVVVENRESTQDYLATVRVTPAPVELALTFGDAIQNFRATLDYMARALVVAHGRVPIDGGRGSTQFPIHSAEPAELRVSPGIAEEALIIIDSVQPYRATDPSSHPLWRLQEISNHDKHRLLHVTAISGTYSAALVPLGGLEPVTLTEEAIRYPIQLVDGHQEVIRPASGYFGPARLAGMKSYTVVLGGSDTAWSEQLMLIGLKINKYLIDEVLPPLADIVLRTPN